MEIEKIKDLIRTYKIHNAMLANWIGIKPSSFCDKMNEKQKGFKFSPEQQEKLTKSLRKMAKELSKI